MPGAVCIDIPASKFCICQTEAFLLFPLIVLLTRPLRRCASGRSRQTRHGNDELRFVASLAVASPKRNVLDWTPHRSLLVGPPHHLCKKKQRKQGWVCRVLWGLLGGSIPCQLPIAPVAFSVWSISPTCATAMTRAATQDDPPGVPYSTRRPHLIPPDELTTHVGTCEQSSLGDIHADGDSDRLRFIAEGHSAESWITQDGCLDKGSEWLGVYMHTPHYQMQQLAVRPAERTFLEVTKVLHAHATAPARQIFDTIVPLRPQRLTGFLSVLRFSSAARCTGTGGQAAVVVDLSCVGGGYFACILPKELSHHALMTYAQPLTSCEAEELDFFIGCRSRPWPPCAGVVLSDGDVITGMRKGIGSFAKIQAESLFHAGAYWDYPSNMIRFTYRESVCVLHRNRRYLLPHYHHYDQNIVEYVSRSLRLDPHCTLMCSYPIRDLEVQGDLSTFLIAVAEVPSPLETGLSRDQARDIFVLLDPRPMGIKPHFIHLQYPVVHLPTIVALLGLSTPAAMRVGVRGGDRRGDDIHVRGNTTLHLFAEEKPAASSSDETETSSLPEAGAHDHQGPSSSEGRRADIVLGVDRDLNEEYSVWEGNGADPLPPSSHIDTTLPQGHSWNAGLSEAGSPRAPTDGAVGEVITGDAEPEPAETAQDRRVNALIYVPDYVPEVVEVQVSFPSTPSQFVAAVDGARCQEQASAFPDLFPAVPQPLQELAVFVAGPKWQLDTATVIFDCRAVQAGFFARAVPRYLNRESLLVAAGFRGEDPISVHVDGLFRPLGIDQRTNMKTGQTVQLVHRYADGPDCFDLEDMLSSGRGWDTEASIPGVQSHFNSHFLILSDAGPFTFEVTPSAFVSFKEALARSLSTTEHRLCVKGSVPKIVDSYRFGFWASGVLVATEKLSAIPCPPAASPETRSILILDQRCILRGFTWRIVQEGCIGVQALADTYYGICPHGCVVTFKGAEAETREEEQVFVIKHGQVLTVEFTLDLDSSGSEVPPPPGPPDDRQNPGTEDHGHPDPEHSEPGHSESDQHTPTAGTGGRSRSPRQRNRHHDSSLAITQVDTCKEGCSCRLPYTQPIRGFPGKVKALIYGAKVDMWSADSRDDAQRVGSQCLTPVLSLWHAEDDGRVISTRWPNGSSLSVLGFSPSSPFPSGKTLRAPCWVHKLLIEPSTASLGRDSAYERAREATRLLGDSWPFPPYRWPIAFDDGSDSDLPAVMDDEPMTVDVSVYLLSPEYTPEHLPLTVVLPQTVRELTDLIEVCRDPTQKDLFPVLVEVTPQPDPGWGIFLALPVWATHSTAICCDLSLFDGRIFAIVVPETVSSYDLCARAGLAHNAEVDIFLPGEIEPLVPGGEVRLQRGMCVTFVGQGVRRPATFDLQAMLRSHLGWEHSPVFPRDRLENGYCVAAPHQHLLFRLHAERSIYYRTDIALLAGLHPTRTVVTPAAPQPRGVTVRGWECRAVIAATDRESRRTWDGHESHPVVGLLDCRPLFAGWLPVWSWDTWLNLEPIRNDLQQGAPEGWTIVFPQLPSHWTWICWSPGQIVVVALLQDQYTQPINPAEEEDDTMDGPSDSRHGETERPESSPPVGSTNLSEQAEGPAHRPSEDASWGTRWGTIRGQKLAGGSLAHTVCRVLIVAGVAALLSVLQPYQTDATEQASVVLGAVLVKHHAWLGVLLCLWADGVLRQPIGANAVQLLSTLPAEPRGEIGPAEGLEWKDLDAHSVGGIFNRRPIPSPCRAWLPCTAGSTLPASTDANYPACTEEALVTLLEASVRDPSSHAFFNARTLLEVLTDHHSDQQARPATVDVVEFVGTKEQHVPLFLADHLPSAVCHDLSAVTFDLGFSLDHATTWFKAGSWDLQRVASLTASLPEFVRDLLGTADHNPESSHLFEEIRIFTDGSFDGSTCSWAFGVFATQQGALCFLGWASGPVPTDPDHPLFIGACRPSAICGEQHALIWAAIWCMQAPMHCCSFILSDCLVALNQATGVFGWHPEEKIPPICRAAIQALASGRPTFCHNIQHVRSHQGIPANELVDSLAKQANRGTHPGACEHMLWTAAQIRAGALDWLWLQVETTTHPGHWPTQIGRSFVDLERFSDCIPFTTEESHRAVGMPAPVSEPAWSANCWGAFACLTVNVQSLTETSDMQAQPEETGFNGKSRYLREQLQDMGVHIAALQEARSPADATFVSASHIRFCAARDAQGNFGCELWFARDIPFATNNGTQAFFHPNDFLVVGNGPRELFVRFSRAGLKILFVCLHAPVGTSKDRDAWWHALSRRICRLSRDALVMLLGDFNTGFHHSLNSRVGDLVWPSSHGAPRDLDKIIDCHDLWIPSTFSQCHYGQHHTWVSPAGTSSARLDYVAIPSSWHVPQKGSRVDTSLDWGQARVDHFGLAVRVLFPISIAKNHQAGRAKLDREQLATEQGRQAINEICRNIPMQPWTSNVHRHYAQIEDFLGRSLMLAFPTKRGSCRSSHFTAATWDLRQRRSWLRKQVNREGVTLRLADAWVALITWRRGLGIRAARALTALRLVACQRRFAGLLAEMRSTKAVLRHSIRQDVAKRVQETAAVAAQTTKADVVSRLRPLLGPPRRRSRQQQALRGICHPNGDPALTLEEAEDLWIGHFAGIEDGTRVDPVQLVNECQAFQCSKDLDALALDTNSVPTRAQLEQSLRHTESNRAIGLDGVPGELLRFAAGTASTALFQLFLKVSMRAAEPIQFKGGALHAVWKGKSSATQCSAHRGILVSSTPGKAFHRVVRQQAVPALRSVATDMQIGGLPKFPVTMASHFVRAFQEGCQNRRCSHGLMFLDLREAFYRVVRPLLTGTSFCDEVVALVAQRINLPSGVMHELHRHLQQESLPAEAGASEWASAQLCEAMHSTWFRFQGSHTVVKTGVGSRPGDNLADVCFSFIFAKVLEAIRSELRGQGCLPSIPWSADMTDNLGEIRATADNRVEVLDATWMDDATFFVACDSAASLPESMASTGSAVLQSCVARALLPNLDKGKTEFIACAVGPGSRKVRRQLFSMPEATIRTSCRLWADASVRLVPTYQHLGGFVHHDGTMSRELRHRASLAWKAFNTRKKKVFAAPNVDPKDKAVLYETLVLTVLLHGAGTWRDLTPQEFSILEQAHFGMTFFMLRPLYTYDEALHLGGAHAVSVLGLPSLKTLLHVARLRQLLSYVRTPVAAFWAMLHWQGSWLAACRSSMQWLWSMTDNGVRHSQWISAWKDWHVMCQERPQAWKGLVRRAQAQAVDIEASEVAKRRHIGLVGRQLRWAGALLPAPYRDEARQQHFCAPCNMCFKTFQAWSVHAFKVHGRTTEGRRIQKGTQCQACLRHFTTHIKLCRHLNQQKECRTLLQTAGYSCHVEPGQGSRKAPDEGKFQAPTLQAQGPRLQAASYDWLGELERPSAEVLDCLALLGVGLEDFPCVEDAVWERVKQAFSCVCLPVRKILATAARWADNLSNGDWQSNIDRSLLLHIAGWVQGADLACWLVPDPAVKLPLWTTFRDAEITLPLLDMSAVCPVQPSTVAGVTPICIGPDKWLSRVVGQDRSVVTFVHQDCLSELREGHLPSFFQGPFEDTVFVISICGLPTWGDLPLPPIRRKHFLPRLTEAIFACDLVRLALRLWLKGIPTTLVFPSRCEFVPQPVSALPFLEPIQSREHCGMRSAGADWDKCSVSPF